MIFPQATKYIETQKDPFAKLFDCFRKSLMVNDSHVLAIIGYSFGDDHINTEIDYALRRRGSKTVVIAFSKELANEGNTALPATLEKWRSDPVFGNRIYVASDKALYCGKTRLPPAEGTSFNWWNFSGLTKFLAQGTAQ